MVGMVKAPDFKIEVNGEDVTERIRPHFKSLSLTDNDKEEADELTLALTSKFKKPDYADEIKVYLGYMGETLKFAGKFYVQKTNIRNNKELTITATGVNLKTDIKVRKSITHEGTVQEMLEGIAAGHNYKLKSDIDFSGVFEQLNESDMSFMNRIANASNAVFNIKNDTIYFVSEEVETVVPSITVDIDKCYSSDITESNTASYKSACAKYQDTKLNKALDAKTGDEQPQLVIHGKYLDHDEAMREATNALKRANKAQVEGNLTMAGQVVFAGSILNLNSEQYTISTVTHEVSKGWKVTIDFKSSNKK